MIKYNCNDAQPNNIQHNDAQHNDTQHNDTQHNYNQHNDTHHIGKYLLCCVSFMQRATNKLFMLSVDMLNVIMPSVVMQNVEAPKCVQHYLHRSERE